MASSSTSDSGTKPVGAYLFCLHLSPMCGEGLDGWSEPSDRTFLDHQSSTSASSVSSPMVCRWLGGRCCVGVTWKPHASALLLCDPTLHVLVPLSVEPPFSPRPSRVLVWQAMVTQTPATASLFVRYTIVCQTLVNPFWWEYWSNTGTFCYKIR